MPDTSTRLQLPYIRPSQAQKHVTHNEAVQRLDALVQMTVIQLGAEVPPPAPEPGDMHALGASPTGVWAGQAGKLAVWENGVWAFITPLPGWRLWDQASSGLRVYDGSDWQPAFADLDNLNGVGIGASFDPVNRLVVAAEASLFTDLGAGHQVKINKAATPDTASLLFQSGYTGFAEMGLAGDNRFSVKVSPDGSSWFEAMKVDAGAQSISLAPGGTVRATFNDTGLELNVPITGAAVQASHTDVATAGKLVRVDGARAAALAQMGGYFPPASGANIDTASAGDCGLYHDSNVGTWPLAAAGRYWWIATQRSYTGGAVLQNAYPYAGAGAPVSPNLSAFWRYRANSGGAWSPWMRVYNSHNIVGAVSHTGGVPTGAIIERGSNANGNYIRFADGTQICTRNDISVSGITNAIGALFRPPAVTTWVFPSAFIAAPVVTAAVDDPECLTSFLAPSTSSIGIRTLALLSKAGSVTVRAMAVGRWF